MFYKYAPSMMEHVPRALIDVLIQQPQLVPRRLMPALLKYDHRRVMKETNEVCIQD
jgi:pyruvate/2-oxoglutarate dehydrogenase complex dihydrolipoamide acyltransferase (E2) component